MAVFLVRRALLTIPTIFGIVTIAFFVISLMPGDPVQIMAGSAGASPEYRAFMRGKLGLDQPLMIRYGNYVIEVAKGNLGISLVTREPVGRMIRETLPATLLLGISSLLLALCAGVLLGVYQARYAGRPFDFAAQLVSVAGYSVPLFWLGQLLLLLFAVNLGWFPLSGSRSVRDSGGGIAALLDLVKHLVLPAICLATYNMAVVARLTRSKVLEILREDYIVTARAKGLSASRINFAHVLRNAMAPVITVTAMSFGFLLASTLVIETVFGWPGTGRLMYQSILSRDYPAVLGVFLVLSVMVIFSNVLADVLIACVDPRVRLT